MRKITWKRRKAMIQAAIPVMIAHWRNQYSIDYLGIGKSGTNRENAKKRFWHDVSKIAKDQYTIGEKS